MQLYVTPTHLPHLAQIASPNAQQLDLTLFGMWVANDVAAFLLGKIQRELILIKIAALQGGVLKTKKKAQNLPACHDPNPDYLRTCCFLSFYIARYVKCNHTFLVLSTLACRT